MVEQQSKKEQKAPSNEAFADLIESNPRFSEGKDDEQVQFIIEALDMVSDDVLSPKEGQEPKSPAEVLAAYQLIFNKVVESPQHEAFLSSGISGNAVYQIKEAPPHYAKALQSLEDRIEDQRRLMIALRTGQDSSEYDKTTATHNLKVIVKNLRTRAHAKQPKDRIQADSYEVVLERELVAKQLEDAGYVEALDDSLSVNVQKSPYEYTVPVAELNDLRLEEEILETAESRQKKTTTDEEWDLVMDNAEAVKRKEKLQEKSDELKTEGLSENEQKQLESETRYLEYLMALEDARVEGNKTRVLARKYEAKRAPIRFEADTRMARRKEAEEEVHKVIPGKQAEREDFGGEEADAEKKKREAESDETLTMQSQDALKPIREHVEGVYSRAEKFALATEHLINQGMYEEVTFTEDVPMLDREGNSVLGAEGKELTKQEKRVEQAYKVELTPDEIKTMIDSLSRLRERMVNEKVRAEAGLESSVGIVELNSAYTFATMNLETSLGRVESRLKNLRQELGALEEIKKLESGEKALAYVHPEIYRELHGKVERLVNFDELKEHFAERHAELAKRLGKKSLESFGDAFIFEEVKKDLLKESRELKHELGRMHMEVGSLENDNNDVDDELQSYGIQDEPGLLINVWRRFTKADKGRKETLAQKREALLKVKQKNTEKINMIRSQAGEVAEKVAINIVTRTVIEEKLKVLKATGERSEQRKLGSLFKPIEA
ncbi:hypothetical protein KKH43_03990 [Patescibacteria group bacterium]|nr:hypothetical protein [Patescibacteria group bacterium]